MMLAAWIDTQTKGFAAAARLLSIEGINPGATLARIARGERQPDADMVARIVALTAGAVTTQDMHEIRLSWLRANRPEKLEGLEAAQ